MRQTTILIIFLMVQSLFTASCTKTEIVNLQFDSVDAPKEALAGTPISFKITLIRSTDYQEAQFLGFVTKTDDSIHYRVSAPIEYKKHYCRQCTSEAMDVYIDTTYKLTLKNPGKYTFTFTSRTLPEITDTVTVR